MNCAKPVSLELDFQTKFGIKISCKNLSGDTKFKWVQTMTPRWFHEPIVEAHGKYDSLQTRSMAISVLVLTPVPQTQIAVKIN
jgi:hypothetical protein